MKKEKLKNLFVKIYQTEFYQRLFYRPFHAKTTLSGLSGLLWVILIFGFFFEFLLEISVKAKPESELYETTGIVVDISLDNGAGSKRSANNIIVLKTDNNETIRFFYGSYHKGSKLYDRKLKGKKITIYSNIPPINFNKPFVDKAIDENGNVLREYGNYEKMNEEVLTAKQEIFLFIFCLMLIYLMNGSKKYKNNENQNLTKE